MTMIYFNPHLEYRSTLKQIREALPGVNAKVANWSSLSENEQGNIVLRLKGAALNLLTKEQAPFTIYGVIGSVGKTYANSLKLVVKNLNEIQSEDLSGAPSKAQRKYQQKDIEKVMKALSTTLDWLDSRTFERSKVPENRIEITQPKLEGLSEYTGHEWTMPLVNGCPLSHGAGGMDRTFGVELEGRRDHFLRLVDQEITIAQRKHSTFQLRITNKSSWTTLFGQLEPIHVPKVVIELIYTYWGRYGGPEQMIWMDGLRENNPFYPDGYQTYLIQREKPRAISYTHDCYVAALPAMREQIKKYEAEGMGPQMSGEWVRHDQFITYAHVTLTKPIAKEVLLVGYPGENQVTQYDALVTTKGKVRHVEAYGSEYHSFSYSMEVNHTSVSTLLHQYNGIYA